MQLTTHNKDFSYKIYEDNVIFNSINLSKNNLNLSNKTLKIVESLSELYILFGKEHLKALFNKNLD